MLPKRVLIAVSILAVCGWAISVSLMLRQVRNSLPDLRSFEPPPVQSGAQSVPAAMPVGIQPSAPQRPAERVPAITLQAEVQLPFVESAPEAVTAAVTLPPEIPVEDQIPLSVEERCGLLDFGVYADEIVVDRDFLLSLSDGELMAIADSEEDGFFNFWHGESIMFDVWERLDNGAALDEVAGSLEVMRKYYIRAIRNHSRKGASWIASHYWNIDKVEARAWWRIDEMMGGQGLARQQQELGQFIFTDQENSEGLARAEELIIEYNLASGIGVPEECLTADEIEEQRSMLAALYSRLSQRAMPSEAPDARPTVFDRLNGHDLVVENVCSLNCPLDTRRVIYYQDVPDGEDCSLAEGRAHYTGAITYRPVRGESVLRAGLLNRKLA